MKKHHLMIAALLLGSILGIILNVTVTDPATQELIKSLIQNLFQPIGQIFLKLIFMVVVPLVISALVLGIYELGAGQGLKKTFMSTILWALILSSTSVFIGVGLVNWIQPGASMQIPQTESAVEAVTKIQTNAAASKSTAQTIVDLIPKNPLESALKAFDGEMLSLMVFSLLFGLAMITVQRQQGKELFLEGFFKEVMETSMVIVGWAMKFAPLAVFSLLFSSVYKMGPDIFKALLSYVFVVVFGLALHLFGTYSFFLQIAGRVKAIEFFKSTREVLLTAFSTASSNATLPQSLKCAEHDLKLPPKISRFVLTVGATANQNGTALFEGITVLFLAQVYHIDLTVAQQVQVVIMSILAGVGTAGVPGGSLPLIMIIMQNLGIPAEGIGIILGVDRLLDMCRTTVNVAGDLVIASLVSRHQDNK